MSVVLRVDPSVHKAYRKREEKLSVTDQAIYDKLQCMEPGISTLWSPTRQFKWGL